MNKMKLILSSACILATTQIQAFELNSADRTYSHLGWPFDDKSWQVTPGSSRHYGADKFADDWNKKTGGNSDLGENVTSVMGGKVIYVGNASNSYGNQVVVMYQNYAVRYAHLDSINVAVGDQVHRGSTKIGEVGKSGLVGSCSKPQWVCAHLHVVLYRKLVADDVKKLRKGNMPSSSRAAWFDLDG